MFETLAKLMHTQADTARAITHAHRIHHFEGRYSYRNYRKSAAYCALAMDDVDSPEVHAVLLRYFEKNKAVLWDDALLEHSLLPEVSNQCIDSDQPRDVEGGSGEE